LNLSSGAKSLEAVLCRCAIFGVYPFPDVFSPRVFFLLLLVAFGFATRAAQPSEAVHEFPGGPSLGAQTVGGRGGKIIRVTTLAAEGAGSFAEAVRAKGPRIIVFEVGGVIDLAGKALKVSEPFVTIAGQTAPSPGITFIRGGLAIFAHDAIIQHLRVRPGEAGRKKKSGWEIDGIGLIGASNVIVDHCSNTWATDENLSASGPRFEGATVEEWRKGTAHQVTISNCLIAEALSKSTHGKGEHSKGSLLHDNTTGIAVVGNLYASNVERNPLAKGGVQAVIVNNWISNPGGKAMHHNLDEGEWKGHAPVTSRLAIVGNIFEHGPDTPPKLPLFFNHRKSPVELFMDDNLALDRDRQPVPLSGGEAIVVEEKPPVWPGGWKPMAAEKVREHVAKDVGARPWERDEIDTRIVRAALEGTGKIIDSEQEVGGYPRPAATSAPFNPKEWNLETMERLQPR
jgi:hypothetical protein